jgi:hypothetical protein
VRKFWPILLVAVAAVAALWYWKGRSATGGLFVSRAGIWNGAFDPSQWSADQAVSATVTAKAPDLRPIASEVTDSSGVPLWRVS